MTLFKTLIISICCFSFGCSSEIENKDKNETDVNIAADTGRDISKTEDQGRADFASDTAVLDATTDATTNEPDLPAIDLRLFPDQAEVQAPETFQAKFITSFGDFVMAFERASSPNGVDRFYSLVKARYYEDILIFRAIDGFIFQFGIHGEPEINAVWQNRSISDDPIANLSNTPGTISFASAGPDTRSAQLFINVVDNSFLDNQGFTPLGTVVEGIENLSGVNTEYGENPGGFQGRFTVQGNSFALETFPNLSRIEKIIIVDE